MTGFYDSTNSGIDMMCLALFGLFTRSDSVFFQMLIMP